MDGYYILITNVRAHPMLNLVTERDKMHYIDGGKQTQRKSNNGKKMAKSGGGGRGTL